MPVRIKLRFGCLFGSPFFFFKCFFLFPFRQDHPGLVWISCSLPHSCRVFSSFNSSLQPWRFSLVSFRGYRVSPQPCVFCGYFSFKVLAPWQQYLKKVEFFFFSNNIFLRSKKGVTVTPHFLLGVFVLTFGGCFFSFTWPRIKREIFLPLSNLPFTWPKNKNASNSLVMNASKWWSVGGIHGWMASSKLEAESVERLNSWKWRWIVKCLNVGGEIHKYQIYVFFGKWYHS